MEGRQTSDQPAPPKRPRGNRAPVFQPTEQQRILVERLAAFNISQDAICAELTREGVPCRTTDTLRRRFGPELALGRERMKMLLGHKVLDIALSDRPNNLAAALALLRVLDPAWREPKGEALDEIPAQPALTHDGEARPIINNVEIVKRFRLPDNGRDKREVIDVSEPPVIDSETDEEQAV
jgi:hypothetical protein